MPLPELLRVGSLVYSEDFRTGRILFSKGALTAEEYDPPKDRCEEATARFVSRDDELGRKVGMRVSSQRVPPAKRNACAR
jgi:hypothetical protein